MNILIQIFTDVRNTDKTVQNTDTLPIAGAGNQSFFINSLGEVPYTFLKHREK
jgi:hypothetical protein